MREKNTRFKRHFVSPSVLWFLFFCCKKCIVFGLVASFLLYKMHYWKIKKINNSDNKCDLCARYTEKLEFLYASRIITAIGLHMHFHWITKKKKKPNYSLHLRHTPQEGADCTVKMEATPITSLHSGFKVSQSAYWELYRIYYLYFQMCQYKMAIDWTDLRLNSKRF